MLTVLSAPLVAVLSGAPTITAVTAECQAGARVTPGQVAQGRKADLPVLNDALRDQSALLLELTSDRLKALASDLRAKTIDQATYTRDTKFALELALTSEKFRESAASRSIRMQMPQSKAEVKSVCVVGVESYEVVRGKPVELSLVAGEGQLAGTAVRLNGAKHPFKNPNGPQQIGTGDMTGSVLHVVTSVVDVNPATNRTAVTYTLKAGKQDRDFPYNADVLGDGGMAYYLITFLFD